MFFSTFPYWIKEKSVETLAYYDILQTQTQNTNQHSKNSQFFPPYHRTGDSPVKSPEALVNAHAPDQRKSKKASTYWATNLLLAPYNQAHTPFTTRLCFNGTNTTAEYEACIFGLRAAIDLGIRSLSVFGDSTLVISYIKGEWDTKHPNLISYKDHALTLLPHF